MSEEDINTYKKYISNLDITKYIIKDDEDNYWYSDKYVYHLQTQLQQKEDIIKEVRNWVKSTIDIIKQQPTGNDEWVLGRLNGFLEILDKEVN